MGDFMRVLLVLAIASLFSSCTTGPSYREKLDSYVGHPVQAVLTNFGPPSQVREYGTNKWLIYEWTGNTVAWTNPYTGMTTAGTRSCTTTFVVASEMIASWKYDGNACD
jgi:hypothetical protein